jgi:hypothetical protein
MLDEQPVVQVAAGDGGEAAVDDEAEAHASPPLPPSPEVEKQEPLRERGEHIA